MNALHATVTPLANELKTRVTKLQTRRVGTAHHLLFCPKKRWAVPTLRFLDAHPGVVIGNAADGVDDTAGDEDISFRPMNLQIAARDGCKHDRRVHPAGLVRQ